MENENKESAEVVKRPFWINLFIVRHIAAIARLLILIFWENNFGNDARVMPTRTELDEIYDLWFGVASRVSIKDIEEMNQNIAYYRDLAEAHSKEPSIFEQLNSAAEYEGIPKRPPDAIYLKIQEETEGKIAKIPLVSELKCPAQYDNEPKEKISGTTKLMEIQANTPQAQKELDEAVDEIRLNQLNDL